MRGELNLCIKFQCELCAKHWQIHLFGRSTTLHNWRIRILHHSSNETAFWTGFSPVYIFDLRLQNIPDWILLVSTTGDNRSHIPKPLIVTGHIFNSSSYGIYSTALVPSKFPQEYSWLRVSRTCSVMMYVCCFLLSKLSDQGSHHYHWEKLTCS